MVMHANFDISSTAEYMAEVHHLKTSHMMEEEQRFPSFICKHLQKLSNWNEWDICHNDQINGHVYDGT